MNSPDTPHTIETDITLFGGGIAGLYLLNLLQQLGYQCILLENNKLGYQQTLQAQGIIHGGLKYALTGALSSESDATAKMPDRWRKLLKGEGTVPLPHTQVISNAHYMWSSGKVGSGFTTFFASKMLRGRIKKLSASDYPPVFQAPSFKGHIYRLSDFVLDTSSLLEDLLAPCRDRVIATDSGFAPRFEKNGNGNITSATVRLKDGSSKKIKSQRFIFCAGEGNGPLIEQAKLDQPSMQIRPLHMLMIKHQLPYDLFAHCIGTGSKPRVTITTHRTEDGYRVWYMGGDIAESGIDRDSEAQIKAGKKELHNLFPWLDFSDAQWASFMINRAEQSQQALVKPNF